MIWFNVICFAVLDILFWSLFGVVFNATTLGVNETATGIAMSLGCVLTWFVYWSLTYFLFFKITDKEDEIENQDATKT